MRRSLVVLALALVLAAPAHAWTWPAAGPVLVPFSFDPARPYAGGQHRGIDVGGAAGEAVHAPAAGTVTFAGTVPGSGKSLTVLTADGWSVTLTQLGSIGVAKGASVGEGDVVGALAAGDAGGGPYVQLGIRHADQEQGYVDPQSLLPPRDGVAATADPAPAPPAAPAAPDLSAVPVQPVAAPASPPATVDTAPAPPTVVAATGAAAAGPTPAPVPAPAAVEAAAPPASPAPAPPASQAASSSVPAAGPLPGRPSRRR